MRFLIVAGALVLAARSAPAAYVVALDGGDTMTVDSYWEDGDRIHLLRDGVDLNVLRSRVRSLHEVADRAAPAPRPPATHETTAPAASGAKPSREELQAQQSAIEKHLLRVQQERFEAKARGDNDAKVHRLDKEFGRTANRRNEVMRALTKE